LYDSEISFTDEYIGNLLGEVKELGLDDKTLIVFTADHGEEFLERGDFWIGHDKKLYQEQIHVPLMIRLPEKNQGKIVDEYVGLIDLMPSIVNYAGLSIPEKYQHEGKVLDLSKKEELNNRIILSETQRNASLLSVIWKGWKMIHDPEMNTTELFNLKTDPSELENVMSENETILKTLQDILEEWNAYIKTEMPQTKAEKPRFTEEQKEKLRSLGYIK
jgi:arylsulfatase A-like enzyme